MGSSRDLETEVVIQLVNDTLGALKEANLKDVADKVERLLDKSIDLRSFLVVYTRFAFSRGMDAGAKMERQAKPTMMPFFVNTGKLN